MTVYGARNGVYPARAGVYVDESAVDLATIEDWEWGGPVTDQYVSLYAEPGSVLSDVPWEGDYHFRKPEGRTVDIWTHPSDGHLEHYPRPGDEFVSVQTLRGVGVFVIDDFERAALEHYTEDTHTFDIVHEDDTGVTPDSVVPGGSRMLRKDDSASRQITSTSGLSNYFPTGTTSHVYAWCPQFGTEGIHHLFGSGSGILDGYSVQLRNASTSSAADFRLIRYEGGSNTGHLDVETSGTAPTSTWIRSEITRTDNGDGSEDLSVNVYNHETGAHYATLSASGVTAHYTSDAIAFRAQAEAPTAYWDYWHIPESGGNQWQTWDHWGGLTDRYPRYQCEFIQSGTFRVQVRTGSDRYTVASNAESGEPAVEWQMDNPYAIVRKWYSQSIDGRTGVRATLFNADEFPFQAWARDGGYAAYDAGEFAPLDHITECKSEDHPGPDGSDDIPQEPGRYGLRAGNYVEFDHDFAVVLVRP